MSGGGICGGRARDADLEGHLARGHDRRQNGGGFPVRSAAPLPPAAQLRRGGTVRRGHVADRDRVERSDGVRCQAGASDARDSHRDHNRHCAGRRADRGHDRRTEPPRCGCRPRRTAPIAGPDGDRASCFQRRRSDGTARPAGCGFARRRHVPVADLPLEPPARFGAIVAGTVSISVAFAIAGAAVSPAWRIERARGAGSAATGGAQQGRASRPGPQQPGVRVAPSPSGPRPSSAPQVTASQVTARGTEPAVGRDLGRTPAGLKATASRGGTHSASASADRDVPGSTVAAGAPAAGRGAAAETQGPVHAAGGVKGESLRTAASAAEASVADSPLGPAYAARYRTASARAQAAIAQERVPAGLATYVKNYFIAIRP